LTRTDRAAGGELAELVEAVEHRAVFADVDCAVVPHHV